MALTAAQRRNIPSSKFVYPPGTSVGGAEGAYPIDTPQRARAALAYAGQSRTKGTYATVAAAVRRRWPNIEVGGSSSNSNSNSRNSNSNGTGLSRMGSRRAAPFGRRGNSNGEREPAAERRREARNPALEAAESPARQRAERVGNSRLSDTSLPRQPLTAGSSMSGAASEGRSERQLFGSARTRRMH